MPTTLDLLFVALFAVASPVWDAFVTWPAFERRMATDPGRAKQRIWIDAIVYPWILVAAGAAIWIYHARPWSLLGLTTAKGWPGWVAWGLVGLLLLYFAYATAAVAKDEKARESVRQQMFGKIGQLMPRTRKEMVLFGRVALTAGFCEEVLFRGFLIWALLPWLGWWGAAGVSLIIFALGHAYQGVNGVLRTGAVGLFFTLVLAFSGSLWPVIAMHVILDLGQGVVALLALRQAVPE